jgi:cytochrome P450
MIQTLSFFDSLIFNALYSIPSYLQGLFTRNRFWVGFWARVQVDRLAVRFVSRLRARYGGKYFFARVGGAPALLVLDHSGIQHVLARSPFLYGDAASKHRGMSHFQPGAVTISRGEEWEDRRRFNEGVLQTGHKDHPNSDQFLQVIERSVSAMLESAGERLAWENFEVLFEQIAGGIIFGVDPEKGRPLFDRLTRMMREGNRVFALRKSKHFDEFYEGIRAQLAIPGPGSLAALCPHIASSSKTQVENQIPHWMFAIRETLAINTARALALLASHPHQEEYARQELAGSGELTAQKIHDLRYLEGCVQETMRLWPTTPFIAREALGEEVIEGASILPKTQVLILNTFNHRDPETSVVANAFYPAQWLYGPPTLPYLHLSGGPQVCAGKDLALFIAKAVLAALMQKGRYTLERPKLDPSKPLPAMFNHFRLSVKVEKRGGIDG